MQDDRTLGSGFRNYINPIIIEERNRYAASYDIFSRLLSDRIIFLGVPIDDTVANIVQAQLLYLDSLSHEDISIYINSPGGVVSAGYAIYDTMRIVKSSIATVCTGLAASMASVLLMAGEKGKRSILSHAKVMLHEPSTYLGHSKCTDLLIEAEEIKKCREELFKTISLHTGKSFEEVAKDADRDYWLTSKEALDYGIVDIIK